MEEKSREELLELVIDLTLENYAQRARIEAIEEKLGLDSDNSHFPPSSDGPSKGKRVRKGSGKSRGGQPGRKGKRRHFVPLEEVDKVVPVRPDACGDCGGRLGPSDRPPVRHQVWDLPEELRCNVTEYQLEHRFCGRCQSSTRAELPAGVGTSSFGKNVHAMVGYLSGSLRLSDRQVQELLHQVFGLRLATGTVANLRKDVSAALAEPVEAVRRHIRQAEVVHADETYWREEGARAWLWTAVTPEATTFQVRLGRATAYAKELLGKGFSGTLVSDRMGSYRWVQKRQVCWAHLIRDFRRIADRGGRSEPIGRRLEELGEQVLRDWRRVRRGQLALSSYRTYASAWRAEIRDLLDKGLGVGHARTEGTCLAMRSVEPYLWTFLRTPGVEPTNNAAERALRTAVIWRKTRLGTQSVEGSDFVERILTTTTTLRQQGRGALEYLKAAVTAWLDDQSAPALVPA